ncbi:MULTISPECIES: ribonuclease R [unclassified Bosea (in: a-proteobacteria)]|uniref:ribonuclease R n=1 Tax=unclassified Bosea (in: a-proteobacteria) TaxID=2653178 RepID=UPI000955E382|nr:MULTISPECIES: ribonuclease R [unclassified Bosea (in: a-proteobacteria)]TAJ27036.1 MAG: ribonuclease R [Bosea sp. (in: a-proteobacteria)]SIP89748.1 ribonuclease R [Bosea sp. TND4EK4]
MNAPEPSRQAILDFIEEERVAGREVGRREIARAFGLDQGGKIWLKRILKEMEREGEIGGDGDARPVHPRNALPPVLLCEIKTRDRDGDLVAQPLEWNETDQGPPPRIVIETRREGRRKAKDASAAPGVGDQALLKLTRLRGVEGYTYSGHVLKVMGKAKAAILGIFRALPDGSGRLIPVDKKAREREAIIPKGRTGDAEDGDLVSVSLRRETRFGPPEAQVRERLGSIKSERAVSLIAIHAHGIPNEFQPATLKEAAAAPLASLKGREDWRAMPLITIDPADAKDHDDAVHAAADEAPDNPGGFVVTVAIADVAGYVTPGSSLDREALERGNSVYFPDRVVPMLPERISNDLCSLREQEDRPALAVRLVLKADGSKKSHSFHRVLMRSAAKLSYQQAQAAIDGSPDEKTAPIRDSILMPLWAAYGIAARARDQRQPLELDLPERKLILKADGSVDRVVVPERLAAHRLIEEFMILANVAAAETLEKAGSLLIYRCHDEPSLEKMRALGEVLASIGIKLPKDGALRPALFNRILATIKGSENETLINEVVLRTQAQAEYVAENYGHFGLNLRRYAHFTSPIRRYADLIVHRALIAALKLGEDGLPKSTSLAELREVSTRISAAERRAMAAERETTDRLIAHFLADQIGSSFDGRIGGVNKAGLFVKLDGTGADGFIPASTLGGDYYRYDEAAHALTGERTGESWRLGDRVHVKLVEAAPVAGALRFELLSSGRTVATGRAGKRRGPAPYGERSGAPFGRKTKVGVRGAGARKPGKKR